MKIAVTADPDLPVPPRLYGGIERVIDMLVRGLVERGHDVTLFAHPDSASAGRLVSWKGLRAASRGDSARNAATLARHTLIDGYDLIHSFSRIAYLTPLLPLPVPKIMTYQRPISPRTTRLGHSLSRGSLSFTAISNLMMRDVEGIGRWDMIPNGVPIDAYAFAGAVAEDAPLVFLGRIEEIKGPHLAIDIALRSGRRLMIAGNIPDAHRHWAEAHVLPRVDGQSVTYVGPVDDAQKNALLGRAAALLMPILWDEPFGLVMAEAMACGTPVIGLARGAVTEVVQDGITGYVRRDMDGLAEATSRIHQLDRMACRRRVEHLYSDNAVVEGYLALYRARLGRSGSGLVET